MTLPALDTLVTYPAGSVNGSATVLHVELIPGGRFAVLLDETPCHPVDAGWPDQGPDRATLSWSGGSAEIEHCVVAATDGLALHLGGEIPVRKGTEGWAFVVAHVVATAPPEGTVVTVEVDERYRRALSIGHSGCHLASLALNAALADRWSKDAAADDLGHSDFDAAANATSRILERGSVDTYRLGKSLRKKGFVVEGLAESLPAIETRLNETLAGWVAADAGIRIDREGDRLTNRRYWVCSLPQGEVRLACGGTHPESTGALGALRASLTIAEVEGGLELTMETRAG
jgi:alanyl-tRNA synthetase